MGPSDVIGSSLLQIQWAHSCKSAAPPRALMGPSKAIGTSLLRMQSAHSYVSAAPPEVSMGPPLGISSIYENRCWPKRTHQQLQVHWARVIASITPAQKLLGPSNVIGSISLD